MARFISVPLPHDLPENWNEEQYVSPGGVEVGLTPQHGYNYLMKQVNNAQKAIEELDSAALSSNRNLLHNWYWGDVNSIIDQRQGYVVPGTAIAYLNPELTNEMGVVGAWKDTQYVSSTVRKYQSEGSTFYVRASDCVRGYATEWEYTIDRWLNPTTIPVLVNSDNISFRSLDQFVEDVLPEGVYTASVLLADGSFYTGSSNYAIGQSGTLLGGNGVIDVYVFGDTSYNRTRVRIQAAPAAAIEIVAVKLEHGEQQTLAYQDKDGIWTLIETPDKNQELLACCMSEADPNDRYTNNAKTASNVGAEVRGLVHAIETVTTNDAITSTVKRWIESMPDLQTRNFVLSVNELNLVLDGGAWFVAISKANATHAVVIATRYDVSGVYMRGCSLNGGTLTGWITLSPSPVVPATVE